jgi:hypothetical protein
MADKDIATARHLYSTTSTIRNWDYPRQITRQHGTPFFAQVTYTNAERSDT